MALSFDHATSLIGVPQIDAAPLLIQSVINAIRDEEASERGITHDQIADATGKADLGGGVYTGITLALRDSWMLNFATGAYQATIDGGNLADGLSRINNTGSPESDASVCCCDDCGNWFRCDLAGQDRHHQRRLEQDDPMTTAAEHLLSLSSLTTGTAAEHFLSITTGTGGTFNGWRASDLYQMLDEPTMDNTDFIFTDTVGAVEVIPMPPQDPSITTFSYGVWSPSGNGIAVRLRNRGDSSLIAEWTHATLGTTPPTAPITQTLTPPQLAAIQDFSAIDLETESL